MKRLIGWAVLILLSGAVVGVLFATCGWKISLMVLAVAAGVSALSATAINLIEFGGRGATGRKTEGEE